MAVSDEYAGMRFDDILDCKLVAARESLKKLLTSCLREKGDPEANIIDVATKTVYCLPADKEDTFFDHLETCRRAGLTLHLMERQYTTTLKHSGTMIDLDISQPIATRQITSELCTAVVDSFFAGVSKHTTIDLISTLRMPALPTDASEQARAKFRIASGFFSYVLYRADITRLTTDTYRDGVHIYIPAVRLSKHAKRQVTQFIVDDFESIAESFGISLSAPAAKIVDLGAAANPIHFMGSCKVDGKPYVLSSIVRTSPGHRQLNSQAMTIAEHDSLMSTATGAVSMSVAPPAINGTEATSQRTWPFNLCHTMALGFVVPGTAHYTADSSTEILSAADLADEVIDLGSSVDITCLADARARELRDCLRLLDASYYNDYTKWFKVLCVIANCSRSYKHIAEDFSRQSEKYSPEIFRQKWEQACAPHSNPLTIGALIHWVKEIAPEQYNELKKQSYVETLTRAAFKNRGEITHADAAVVLVRMLDAKLATDVDENTGDYKWYEHVMPGQKMEPGQLFKWRHEVVPETLFIFINDNLRVVYDEIYDSLLKRRDKSAEAKALLGDERIKINDNYWKDVIKNFKKSSTELGKNPFQCNVVSQARFRFRRRGFIKNMDANPMLLGVSNGVLVFGPDAHFVGGYHDYLISKYISTDYVPYDESNPYIQKLLSVYRDIYPIPDVFEYMMYRASTALDARGCRGSLLIIEGSGQNGKTTMLEHVRALMETQFATSLRPTLLTAPTEKADGANSALASINGKRWLYFDEFRPFDVINEARLKTLINPSPQPGRDLYKKEGLIYTTAEPLAATNYPLKVNTVEHATWRRIEYFKTDVAFRPPETYDPTNPHHRLEDRSIISDFMKDPAYKSALLAILVEWNRRLWVLHGGEIDRVPRPTITAMSLEYRNTQDNINRFITTRMTPTFQAPDILLSTVVQEYMHWYRKTILDVKLVNVEVLTEQFKNSRLKSDLLVNKVDGLVVQNYVLQLLSPVNTDSGGMSANGKPSSLCGAM